METMLELLGEIKEDIDFDRISPVKITKKRLKIAFWR